MSATYGAVHDITLRVGDNAIEFRGEYFAIDERPAPTRWHGATIETLERRTRYGGRKGRRAERRIWRGEFAPPPMNLTAVGLYEAEVAWRSNPEGTHHGNR